MSSEDWGSLDADPGWRHRDDSSESEPEAPSLDDGQSRVDRYGDHVGPGQPVDLDVSEYESDGLRGVACRAITSGKVDVREEAVRVRDGQTHAREMGQVVNAWRRWMDGYGDAHFEYVNEETGERARGKMLNSYMEEYANRYYAKVKGLEREIKRRWGDESLTTVMLTLSASNRNSAGGYRCPADHIRDVLDGWGTARKQLYNILDGREWEYARIGEPHKSGYGHFHIAVFVRDGDGLTQADFAPFMRSYVSNTEAAGWEAHRPDGDAVSVRHDIENLAGYISEYIAQFSDSDVLDRGLNTQLFYATCWATGTRRVSFSNGAQELIAADHFKDETGLDAVAYSGAFERWRGGMDAREAIYRAVSDGGGGGGSDGSDSDGDASAASEGDSGNGTKWRLDRVCNVTGRDKKEPAYSAPPDGGSGGGVSLVEVDNKIDDEPRDMGAPPSWESWFFDSL